MKNYRILVLFSLLLAACTTPPTPFLDVTTTPTPVPAQRFTVRITMGAVEVIRKDTVYLGGIKIDYVADEQGNVRAPIDYVSPICYITPSGACQEQGAADLIVNGVMLSIETGCWVSTKTGDDYTEPI